MIRRILLAVLAPAVLGLAAGDSDAASYKGRNVDGRRYTGTISHNDYGTHRNVEIKFDGDRAYVTVGRGRLILILDEEGITDPAHITAYDPYRGVTWEMAVRGLDL